MALFTFRLPDIGEGIAEAEIVGWHVKVGDRVEEDQPIADMMTDKATVEMESPVAGTVVRLAGEPGQQIAIGSMLVEIETEGEGETPAPPSPLPSREGPGVDGERSELAPAFEEQPAPPEATPDPSLREKGEVLASPAVRARAKQLGIDLAQVKPSGDHIRHSDLDAFLLYGAGQGYRPAGRAARRADEEVKVIGLRRRIAENMAASKRAIPHFSYVEEIDVTALEETREQLNAHRGERPKLTLLPLLIVAICRALPDFPMLNARYDDEAGVVTRHGAVHMGIATQTDAGLMVPVIRDAQDRNVWQLAAEIKRLADAVRAGKARSDELSGSTLTLTSLGPLGGVATTPVINRPEVAIIGPNRIVERPVFRGKEVVPAKLMNLSISCDHRVVDGWDAASFVQAVRKLLETPVLLFAD
ncbi:2-oxo acid dehydrogenase subunit E2 [Sphingobium indicum]|uniref:Dihydrolipoamide acetyltransferase component of pyruvate dehydrogenase complex n=2 Tax=Sphingobium indicum TaxID=332055 RepID=A0A1L5BNR3_SPHIB|nr:dihydrolipoamide acetyltransferase family protein [Sphingobium indicum]APL94412.1 branched-chain alpha-keto acid dehydrogenase subunit E2 [Sphingobium indicum B90A]KEZ00287.1 branched-chain alpha-keto acid dehydrogenase subunit E2 [Sphingomonas sp. BHC-A]NYI24496.1 2-oxoisovalerate dehydrogenase E2 component (dihydrolipoyl transacylase) [Sphingobium indicum]RYM04151.1 2-oxo acid dehydrogenase subunit E2 [Sphingobium indicum]